MFPRVTLLSWRDDNFQDVAGELELQGAHCRHERAHGRSPAAEPHLLPWVVNGDVLALTDVIGVREVGAIRLARARGMRVALMMDGIVEPANTFINKVCGDGFMRPAPVDLVCCAGELDRRILLALGNPRVVATGLPRLERFGRGGATRGGDPAGPVIVAAARTAAFNKPDRERVMAFMRRLAAACRRRRAPVRWRLDPAMCAELGVERADEPLAHALRSASAVITTPSTLALEAMLARVPTALVQPHPRPLWQTAGWVWRDDHAEPSTHDNDLNDRALAGTRACHRAIDETMDGRDPSFGGDIDELVVSVRSASRSRMALQARAIELMCTRRAATNVARVLVALARQPARSSVPVPSVVRRPAALRSLGRKRALRCIACDGDVSDEPERWIGLSARMHAEPELGYDLHVLLIAVAPKRLGDPGLRIEACNARTHLLVIDPAADVHSTLGLVAETIASLTPDIVLPDDTDLTLAAAMRLRSRGVSTIAVAPTDEGDVGARLELYDRWDAGLAGSEACAVWMRRTARGRPVECVEISEQSAAVAGFDSASPIHRLAALFDWVTSRPIDTESSDLGVRLCDPRRWNKPVAEDPDGADAFCELVLRESGYQHIAFDAPDAACDAVVVRASASLPSEQEVALWRAAGLGVAISPHFKLIPQLRSARRAARAAMEDGAERIAIYGCDHDVHSLGALIHEGYPVVGFISDRLVVGDRLMGRPAATPSNVMNSLTPDTVLLASRRFEATMWVRCAPLRDAGVRVMPLFRTTRELEAIAASWTEALERVRESGEVILFGSPDDAAPFLALAPDVSVREIAEVPAVLDGVLVLAKDDPQSEQRLRSLRQSGAVIAPVHPCATSAACGPVRTGTLPGTAEKLISRP